LDGLEEQSGACKQRGPDRFLIGREMMSERYPGGIS
jgi:hypothetical protein